MRSKRNSGRRRLLASTIAVALVATAVAMASSAVPVAAGAQLPDAQDPFAPGALCDGAPVSGRFIDVTGEEAATRAAIDCVVATGLTLGAGPTTFEPGTPVIRRQMAAFVKRLADLLHGLASDAGDVPALPFYDGSADYSDLADDDAAALAIGQLSQAGIVGGFADHTFRPGVTVTRRQMAAFVVRLFDFLGDTYAGVDDYFDDDEGDPGEDLLNILATNGIFQGDGNGNVHPGAAITRRQMTHVLLRTAQKHAEERGTIQAFSQPAGGGVIAFTTFDGVFVANADGSGERRVPGVAGFKCEADPSPCTFGRVPATVGMSSDGRRVAYIREQDGGLATHELETGTTTRTVATSGPDAHGPVWSPDDRLVAYSAGGAVYTLAPDGAQRFSFQAGDPTPRDQYTANAWTPRGKVVFTNSGGNCESSIEAANRDGSGHVVLTHGSDDGPVAVLPDGRFVFVSAPLLSDDGCGMISGWRIYVMNADGSGLRPLTGESAVDVRSDLMSTSPDGRFVLYRTVGSLSEEPGGVVYDWRLLAIDGSSEVPVPFLSEAAEVSWSKTVGALPAP